MKKIILILAVGVLIATAGLAQVSDPMSIGVGARALGMGRSYVAVAEDADALFMNPAGLASSGNPKMTSMYTNLLGDVTYAVIGGVYPYDEKSAIGAGVINASSSSIMLTNSDGSSAGDGRWSNSVVFLSAGTYLNNLPPFKNVEKDVLVGGSVKYYANSGGGSNDVVDVASAAGYGYSADLGLLYPANDYLTLGANLQNVFAGSINRASGLDEQIPSNIKIGARACLIGPDGKSFTPHGARRLYLNADYDMPQGGSSNITHLGLEFWPALNFAVRGGLDGDNVTAGLGIRVSGIELNYAYHPFDNVSDNTTHFFSIGYLGEGINRLIKIKLDDPLDKSMIYEDHVKVAGSVEIIEGDTMQPASGAIAVKVNGVNIPLNKDLSFSADVPVNNLGKNLLVVEASNNAGDYSKEEVRILRLLSFKDVPEGYWAKNPIENTGTIGLVEGYPDQTFQPKQSLTRAELTTLLVRAKGLTLSDAPARQVFPDVPADHWAAKYIEVAKAAGLVKGYEEDGTFRPDNRITKAEGVAVLVRFEDKDITTAAAESPYMDVSKDFWAAKYIEAAKSRGMLGYVESNYLKPKSELPRSEAVEMLSKTSVAAGRIDILRDWETGYGLEPKPKT